MSQEGYPIALASISLRGTPEQLQEAECPESHQDIGKWVGPDSQIFPEACSLLGEVKGKKNPTQKHFVFILFTLSMTCTLKY